MYNGKRLFMIRCRWDLGTYNIIQWNYHQRSELIYNLEKKLLKIDREVELEQIVMMINDIRNYLVQRDQEYNTNQ